jgi:hypothetical protein
MLSYLRMSACMLMLMVTLLWSCNESRQDAAPISNARPEPFILMDPELGRAAAWIPWCADIDERPVVAIYDLSLRPTHIALRYAVWSNGRIVWSEDHVVRGRYAYRTGIIEPGRVHRLTASMNDEVRDAAAMDGFRSSYIGTLGYGVIALDDGESSWILASAHPPIERNPELVYLAPRVEELRGRERAKLLAEQDEGYQQFRVLWDHVLDRVGDLVPDESTDLETEFRLGRRR